MKLRWVRVNVPARRFPYAKGHAHCTSIIYLTKKLADVDLKANQSDYADYFVVGRKAV